MTPVEAAARARSAPIWIRRPDLRTLELTGPDRVRYLNGQVTADVTQLRPGQGALAVKTSAKGRTEALMRVRATQDALLLDLRSVVADAALSALDRYIIMDDCAIRDVSASREVITVIGAPSGHDLEAHGFVTRADGVTVVRDATLDLEGYELHFAPGQLPALPEGGVEATLEALEILRIEASVPADGHDLSTDVIPLEAHLEHAISTTKGCYSGQEVIARAMNLGGVQWSLAQLAISGHDIPAVGSELFADEGDAAKAQGQVTSACWSPRAGGPIALAFVRRNKAIEGTVLRLGDRRAIVTAPVRLHESRAALRSE